MSVKKYLCAAALALSAFFVSPALSSELNQHWRVSDRAIVLDGYEFNEFDLTTIAKNKRIAAFIHKGSDGLPAKYSCGGNATAFEICKEKWRRYSVAKELYNTRRSLAKALDLKWGAYHLARPGNPLEQARHFLSYTTPAADDVMVLDIEDINPKKWMSLSDAEIFVNYIFKRTGRYPMLYTNGSTAQHIANNRDKYEILSRLPLWYARYKTDIRGHFPKGNWESYDIWQFQAQLNCSARRCPYPVKGANRDIDVNVVDMSVEELKAAWPFDQLHERNMPKEMPIPMARPNIDIQENIMLASAEREISPMVVKANTSPTALYQAYLGAALARGAKVPAIKIDAQSTASVKAKMNDLF